MLCVEELTACQHQPLSRALVLVTLPVNFTFLPLTSGWQVSSSLPSRFSKTFAENGMMVVLVLMPGECGKSIPNARGGGRPALSETC